MVAGQGGYRILHVDNLDVCARRGALHAPNCTPDDGHVYLPFVFSDGHGIAAYTQWFDDLADLARIDWKAVHARYWADTVDDMDRQRRKQAEFLVHQQFP